ncbi:MAG: hypothetical protein JSR62_05585 [Nitrospira sp.]|nr:hypothetical protein [Nitrospira sp.]
MLALRERLCDRQDSLGGGDSLGRYEKEMGLRKSDRWNNPKVGWVGCILMVVIGCALLQEEVIYLTEAERLHATQDEVKRRLRQ